MSILLFYYALLGIFAITSVVAPPPLPVQLAVAPGESMFSIPNLLYESFHRVEAIEPGTSAPSWPYAINLDDVLMFRIINGQLGVAHTRLKRRAVLHENGQLWCMDPQGPGRAWEENFYSNRNYKSMNLKELDVTGYWINGTEFSRVSHFLRRFGNSILLRITE